MALTYTYSVKTDKTVDEAVKDVKRTLAEKGFGTLWELNVPSKLQEKGVDYRKEAVILEVCNPVHAKNALEANLQVIYFLPCKVVVFEETGKTSIGMMLPSVMMENLQDPSLKAFALEVEDALRIAIDQALI